MVEMSDFIPVEMKHRDEFKEHYRNYPVEHSDYLHGIMCTWKHYMSYFFARVDGSLLILGEHDGKYYLRPPVGPMDRKVFQQSLDLAKDQGWEPHLAMVGEDTRNFIHKEFPEVKFEYHRDYFDYIYRSADLKELPGKSYLKIRNYLNKFRKNHDHSVEPISQENIKDVKDFLVRWCEEKGCSDDPFLMQERQATMFALENFFDLGFEGLCIRIDGRVEALSIFEEMRPDTAVIHYEKASFGFTGLYQAINNEAAKALAFRYRFINRESDMGVPGLRRAKEKYRPYEMLKVSHGFIR